MMNDDRVSKCAVKCDLCGWELSIYFEDISDWHNTPCPDCGKGEIVNDKDMEVYRMTKIFLSIDDAIDPDRKMKRVTVKVDTAGMRETE